MELRLCIELLDWWSSLFDCCLVWIFTREEVLKERLIGDSPGSWVCPEVSSPVSECCYEFYQTRLNTILGVVRLIISVII